MILFYVQEDAGVWAPLRYSFHMYLNHLGPVSCVTSWDFLFSGSPWEWLQSRWQVFFSSLSSSRSSLQFLMAVRSLFTVTTGNIPLLRPYLGSRPTSYFIHEQGPEQSRSVVARATDTETGWSVLQSTVERREWGCFIPEEAYRDLK